MSSSSSTGHCWPPSIKLKICQHHNHHRYREYTFDSVDAGLSNPNDYKEKPSLKKLHKVVTEQLQQLQILPPQSFRLEFHDRGDDGGALLDDLDLDQTLYRSVDKDYAEFLVNIIPIAESHEETKKESTEEDSSLLPTSYLFDINRFHSFAGEEEERTVEFDNENKDNDDTLPGLKAADTNETVQEDYVGEKVDHSELSEEEEEEALGPKEDEEPYLEDNSRKSLGLSSLTIQLEQNMSRSSTAETTSTIVHVSSIMNEEGVFDRQSFLALKERAFAMMTANSANVATSDSKLQSHKDLVLMMLDSDGGSHGTDAGAASATLVDSLQDFLNCAVAWDKKSEGQPMTLQVQKRIPFQVVFRYGKDETTIPGNMLVDPKTGVVSHHQLLQVALSEISWNKTPNKNKNKRNLWKQMGTKHPSGTKLVTKTTMADVHFQSLIPFPDGSRRTADLANNSELVEVMEVCKNLRCDEMLLDVFRGSSMPNKAGRWKVWFIMTCLLLIVMGIAASLLVNMMTIRTYDEGSSHLPRVSATQGSFALDAGTQTQTEAIGSTESPVSSTELVSGMVTTPIIEKTTLSTLDAASLGVFAKITPETIMFRGHNSAVVWKLPNHLRPGRYQVSTQASRGLQSGYYSPTQIYVGVLSSISSDDFGHWQSRTAHEYREAAPHMGWNRVVVPSTGDRNTFRWLDLGSITVHRPNTLSLGSFLLIVCDAEQYLVDFKEIKLHLVG